MSTILGGPTLWPLEAARDVLRWYREAQPTAPEDVFGFFAFLTVPPVAPFPAELHLRKMCGIVWCFTGPRAQADEIFASAFRVAKPALHGVHEMPYPTLQAAFDGLYPPGDQWYWRGDFVVEIPDAAIGEPEHPAGALIGRERWSAGARRSRPAPSSAAGRAPPPRSRARRREAARVGAEGARLLGAVAPIRGEVLGRVAAQRRGPSG